MAIKFLNIRSREVRIAETEPQITAMWASSDRSPNITQGQDFGWRLAPEVVVQLKQIKADYQKIQEIAIRYALPTEAVGEPEILQFISDQTPSDAAPVAEEGDYSDEYAEEIRRLENSNNATPETVTTTTHEDTIDELEAKLAVKKAEAAKTTTTTTTTTTTKVR
jgi:hypothetical protein